MSENAAAGGSDPLTLVQRHQFLASEFELRTNSAPVIAQVRAMAQEAQQEMAISSRHRLTVLHAEDEFRIEEEGGADDFELTAFYAARNVVERMFRRALANMPDHIQLRAALGTRAGRSFLIAGPRGAGKTTLALRLLFEGYEIAGDDLVLLRDGEAVAFPWRFLVPESSVALLPALRTAHPVGAFASDPGYDWRFAVDPTSFGRPWRITPAPVETILYLEPNFGARTAVLPIGKLDMMRHLLQVAGPPPSRRGGWIGDLARTADRAKTFVLQSGDLDSAVLAVKQALA